jgi:hypothetical protein
MDGKSTDKDDEYYKILEEIAEKVNKSDDGISRFLQANPYTDFDFYSFGHIVTPDIFFKYLYFESETAKNKRIKIYNMFKNDDGKNTVFLLGYQGCGKTTFTNILIDYYCSEYHIKFPSFFKIDCDTYALISERNDIRKLFMLSFKKYISNQEKPLENFLSFFGDNNNVLSELSIYTDLLKFYKYFSDFSPEKDLKNPENIDDLIQFIENGCTLKIIFYIIFIISISSFYDKEENAMPYFFVIDNLDIIQNHKELKNFIRCIDDFTIEINKIFNRLKLYSNSQKNYNYTSKIKIVVTMRETTRAFIPNTHYSDVFRAIYTNFDVTEWYNKDDIAKKRIKYLLDAKNLSPKKRKALKYIYSIMEDTYTRNVFIPLFNNNYRKAVPMIADIVYNHLDCFDDYFSIKSLYKENYKHGARGILIKFIIDSFNSERGDFKHILKLIGAIDSHGKKNNEISIARVILSYLSNYTKTECGAGENSITLSNLMDNLNFIFSEQKIMKSILNVYSLKDSIWTHLISFNTLEYINNKIIPQKTTLHYSYAGKIYLEMLTTHFEFFSARIFKDKYYSLFCKDNRVKDINGYYLFDNIIENVFIEVRKCCNILSDHNTKICIRQNYPSPANDNKNSYLNSHFVAMIKTDEMKKQFHEERLVTSHIGYIDIFRIYLLNVMDITFEDKKNINEILYEHLVNYVRLLNSIPVCYYAKHELIPYYLERLIDIKNKDFEDFSIEVNRPDN